MIDFSHMSNFASKVAASANTIRSIEDLKVGTAEKTEVFRSDKMRLYRYAPTHSIKVKTPVLISYALVNRYYMIDLDKNRSLVRRLLSQGVDLYLIDWGYPNPADRFLDLDDYINGYMYDAVQQVKQHAGIDAINLLGICQGGVFALCYTALYPEDIKNLITMVAPFDFLTPKNTLGKMAQHIDAHMAHQALGNFDGELLNVNFSMLNPISLNMFKYIKAVEGLQEVEKAKFFLRMEKWINDSPNQAGRAMAEFIDKLYQKNQLKKGKLSIGQRRVELSMVTHPVLNIYGSQDHIVPPKATKSLKKLIPSEDYTELSLETGHIGMYVSGKSGEIPPRVASWLSKRDS